MQVPRAFKAEYDIFLRESGFKDPDPQALLMRLASLSMEVYLKEIAWLSAFIGRLEGARARVARGSTPPVNALPVRGAARTAARRLTAGSGTR